MVPYYHPRVFERVNIALLDLFDRVRVNRYNKDGSIRKRIRVPVTFHFSKNFANFILNTQSNPESRHTYPILGLRMGALERNSNATTSRTYVRELYDTNTKQMIQDVRPSPWIQNYTLTSYTELIHDHFQMMEQIVPYFNPTFNTAIKEFEFSNLKRDIIVELAGVSPQYNDEVEREKVRSYTCEYNLRVKFDMYSPFYIGNLINEINTKIAISGKNIQLIKNVEVSEMTIDEYNEKLQELIDIGASIDLNGEDFDPNGVQVSNGNRVDTVIASGLKLENSREFLKYYEAGSPEENILVTIPAGKKIVSSYVAVIESFNAPGANISIGTLSNKNLIMQPRESNLGLPAKYEVEFESISFNQDLVLYVFIDGKASTEGSLEVCVKWID